MKMTKDMIAAATPELQDALSKTYEAFDTGAPKFVTEAIEGAPGVFKQTETAENRKLRMELMKTALKNPIKDYMGKVSVNVASNFTPYDLQAPSKHLVPWLSPIRESLPRVKRPNPGATAYWKTVIANGTSYARGGMPASPWVNEGQRAPQIVLSAINSSATYTTMGKDGSVTFEAESSSEGFEDALASAHFFALETLMVSEEDALLGGNKTLKLGTATKPVGSITGSGSFTGGPYYAAVVGLTYEGYRNFVIANGFSTSTGAPLLASGLTQQQAITTGDGKVMTVNSGCGQISAISTTTASPSSSVSATFTGTAKTGEVAWLWYIGTANALSSLYLVACTTVPSYTFTAAPATTAQLASVLATGDFSVNDGTTGGGAGQVTAYDGSITQALNNTSLTPQNAYATNLNGSIFTTGGAGNVVEIDNMLLSMWNLYKVTVDVIYVNAQELKNITARVLNTTSAPLLRYERDGDTDQFDLVGSGVISFYFNPYIPGGKKVPIIVHPTLPPGTLVAYAKNLPSYYKTNSTPNVAEVLERRPYYSLEYAQTTREYQFGTYCESVLGVYAPFCFGIISGIGNG